MILKPFSTSVFPLKRMEQEKWHFRVADRLLSVTVVLGLNHLLPFLSAFDQRSVDVTGYQNGCEMPLLITRSFQLNDRLPNLKASEFMTRPIQL